MSQGNSTQHYDLYLAYTCCFCNAAVVNNIKVDVTAYYESFIGSQRLHDEVSDACGEGIKQVITHISTMKSKGKDMSTLYDGIDSSSNGYSIHISVNHSDCKCAFCGSIAPWNKKINAFYSPNISDNHYPMLIAKKQLGAWFAEQVIAQKKVVDLVRNGGNLENVIASLDRVVSQTKIDYDNAQERLEEYTNQFYEIRDSYESANPIKKIKLKKELADCESTLGQSKEALNLISQDLSSLQHMSHWKLVLQKGYDEHEISRANSFFDKYENRIGANMAIVLNYVGSSIASEDVTDSFSIFERGFVATHDTPRAESSILEEDTKKHEKDPDGEVIMPVNREVSLEPHVTVSDGPKVLFCHKCGYKLHEGSAFCSKCGERM